MFDDWMVGYFNNSTERKNWKWYRIQRPYSFSKTMKTDVSQLNRILKVNPRWSSRPSWWSKVTQRTSLSTLSCLVLMLVGQERDKWDCLIVECKLTPFSKLVHPVFSIRCQFYFSMFFSGDSYGKTVSHILECITIYNIYSVYERVKC